MEEETSRRRVTTKTSLTVTINSALLMDFIIIKHYQQYHPIIYIFSIIYVNVTAFSPQ